MQTSKVLGAVFALAVGAGAFWGLTSGLEAAQTPSNACRDSRLSMLDQNKCASDVKSAATDTARKQVVAEYQAKAATSNPSATSPPSMSPTPDAATPAPSNPATDSPAETAPAPTPQ